MRETSLSAALLLAITGSFAVVHAEIKTKGNVSLHAQVFTQEAIHSGDKSGNLSLAGEVEWYKAFGDGSKSIVFRPFLRAHLDGDSRSHADIRELLYVDSNDTWEFNIGLAQVFWGVVESRNLVDVINQRDQLEGLNTDSKLGQPLVSLNTVQDWGTLGFFILPGFREQQFADAASRPRLPLDIDADAARFESNAGTSHIDYALRYAHVLAEWDIGLSYFSGTERAPQLRRLQGSDTYFPYYYQISQFGLDLQATLESWLLKLELTRQSGQESGSPIDTHFTAVSGFEYSFYGILGSDLDIGLVSEYLWDERNAPRQLFQNDLLLGLRFALNDEQSSEALVGVIADLEDNSYLWSLEGNRRIGDSFKLSAEAVLWSSDSDNDPLFALRQEDYLQLELRYFF